MHVTKDGKVMSFQELKQSYGLNNQDHFREIKHKVHLDKNGLRIDARWREKESNAAC